MERIDWRPDFMVFRAKVAGEESDRKAIRRPVKWGPNVVPAIRMAKASSRSIFVSVLGVVGHLPRCGGVRRQIRSVWKHRILVAFLQKNLWV
jgi:hypothetical protein